jgi:hypothetical protein
LDSMSCLADEDVEFVQICLLYFIKFLPFFLFSC